MLGLNSFVSVRNSLRHDAINTSSDYLFIVNLQYIFRQHNILELIVVLCWRKIYCKFTINKWNY